MTRYQRSVVSTGLLALLASGVLLVGTAPVEIDWSALLVALLSVAVLLVVGVLAAEAVR